MKRSTSLPSVTASVLPSADHDSSSGIPSPSKSFGFTVACLPANRTTARSRPAALRSHTDANQGSRCPNRSGRNPTLLPSASTTGANASAILNSRSPVLAFEATIASLACVCRDPASTSPSSEYHWYAGKLCVSTPVTADAVFTAEPFADVYATSGGVPAPADDEPKVAVT